MENKVKVDTFDGARERPLGRGQKRRSVFNPEHTPGFHRQAQDDEDIRLSSAEVRSRTISPGSRRIDYIEIVDAENLEPVKKIQGKVTIALAVFIGKTRLIDNMVIG